MASGGPQKCPSCGSFEIDVSDAGGDAVCVVCGTVCEESTIVSTVEFSENSGGGSSHVVGQFVSASCTKPYGGSLGGGGKQGAGRYRYGFLRSSRETTLATGRRKIGQVASSLRLGTYYVDGAHRLFAMAAQRNFTQGRKTLHVACACLYVMCRRERSAHMLIDFSDVLQVNVYALGATFLKFRRLLNLELPIIDPSLYIHRFASKLDLGDKTAAVATTALRVAQRMKRDWIETGRRPAGVCAAALLVGSRAHGFHRSKEDVVKALRVGGITVASRLADFQKTPAAQLSLKEFQASDGGKHLATEENPPSFYRKKSRGLMTIKSGDDHSEGARVVGSADGGGVDNGRALTLIKKLPATDEERQAMPIGQLCIFSSEVVRRKAPKLKLVEDGADDDGGGPKSRLYDEIREMLEGDVQDKTTLSSSTQLVTTKRKKKRKRRGEISAEDNNNNNSDDDDDDSYEDEEEDEEDESNFDDVDDDEISGVVLNAEEMHRKKLIWTEMHKEYLQEQEDKDKLNKARAEAQRGYGTTDTKKRRSSKKHHKSSSTSKKSKSSSKKRSKKNKTANDDNDRTAGEALKNVVEKKRFSRKINYEALRGIFGDEDDDEPPPTTNLLLPIAPPPPTPVTDEPETPQPLEDADNKEDDAGNKEEEDDDDDDDDEDQPPVDMYDDDEYGGEEYL